MFRRGDGVSDRQRIAITSLLCGKSMDEAAQAAGVCRKTLYNWRHEDERFAAELDRRRREVYDAAADRLRGLLSGALDALVAQLDNRYFSDDRVRFRAAMAILRLANLRAVPAGNDARRDGAPDGAKPTR